MSVDHVEQVSLFKFPLLTLTSPRQRHFIRNYLEGTKQFIKDNHKYIKRAAGWLALRAWLLVGFWDHALFSSLNSHDLRCFIRRGF